MIHFYGMLSPNNLKIHIALEEMGLAYQTHVVDVFAGAQFNPEFLRLNPNGKVPVIVDDAASTGQPFVVFESGAILVYLADKSGMLFPTDPLERITALSWLMVQISAVGPMFGQYWHFKTYAPGTHEYSLNRYTAHFINSCDAIDRRLGESPFIGGNDYSIVDIATYPFFMNLPKHFPQESERWTNLSRWASLVGERPAVQRGIAAAMALKDQAKDFTNLSDEEKDRYFKRGAFASL